MITTVIFDVDGTLVDTVDMHAQARQRALKAYGKEFTFSAVRSQIGKAAINCCPFPLVFATKKHKRLENQQKAF